MEGDGHDTIGCVECFLYTVAMVNVNVNVQDTLVISTVEGGEGGEGEERGRWGEGEGREGGRCEGRTHTHGGADQHLTYLSSSRMPNTISLT